LATKPKILLVSDADARNPELASQLQAGFEVVEVGPSQASAQLEFDHFAGVCLSADGSHDGSQVTRLLQNERILEAMPDGVVVLGPNNEVIWGNGKLRQWCGSEDIVGVDFYKALENPEILGPDFCPFHTAVATGEPSCSTLRTKNNRYYHVHAAPIPSDEVDPQQRLIVTIRDVTREMLQQKKLSAIHQAGIELADLQPDEVSDMTVEERIELLKGNILQYTENLLHYQVIEIRILDADNQLLQPLLSVGMTPEAEKRVLRPFAKSNGVTGFVAATGKSYLCEDTSEDPLYLEGSTGAASSLTVPLTLHDKVIGTFNVESPKPRAFTESDLQFLEIFTRDLAVAINTLELLAAEKASTAAESVDLIHSAVALPVDDILNDAVNVMECYIGHDAVVADRLRRILRNARDIKRLIQKVGQKMAPAQAHPPGKQSQQRPLLVNRRVLVADEDETVRCAAHDLMERFGCIVETAHSGGEACLMIRNLSSGEQYDVIIADIRLPDMSGYDLMVRLRDMIDPVPLVLMTGFGYDPGHSIVKARRAGLQAVLYKPFRLDQLLQTVEMIVTPAD